MSRAVVRLSKELREAQLHPELDFTLELFDARTAAHQAPVATLSAAAAASLTPSPLPSSAMVHGGASSTSSTDLFTWLAVLRGPKDTPYEGGFYRLILRVPKDYPMVPPSASFITKVFHPNVEFTTGNVCLDILKTKWSPAWTLSSVCLAVLNLLAEPASDSPYNCDAGNLVRARDVEGYTSVVKMYAILYAGAPPFSSWDE